MEYSPILLLAVVLIGFWMVLKRLRLLEERVREVPRPQDLERRFETLEDGVLRLEAHLKRWAESSASLEQLPDRVSQATGSMLGDRLRRSEEHLAEMRQQLEQLLLQAMEAAPPEMAADPLSERLIRYLRREGFGSIRILTDLESADPLEEHRVPVEARRRGVSYKGSVMLYEGRVQDASLKPSYETFP